MNPNYNILLNRIENAIRKTKTYSLSKDECKRFVNLYPHTENTHSNSLEKKKFLTMKEKSIVPSNF